MESLARKPQPTLVEPAEQKSEAAAGLIPDLTQLSGNAALRGGVAQEHAHWGTSLGVVLLAYAAPLTWWVWPQQSPAANLPPPAAMVVELAAMPVAPPVPVEYTPEETVAPLPEPELEPEPEPQLLQPVAEKPEALLEKPPEKLKLEKPKKRKPEKIKERKQEKPESKLQPETTEEALPEPPVKRGEASTAVQPRAQAAAPNQGVSAPVTDPNQLVDWQHSLMTKLHHAKRYPRHSRRLRQEGVVYLRFTVDRMGSVLSASIERSAGHPLLDEETLELIKRAQPLPPLPSDMPQKTLEIVVPVEFFLNR
jgi:protein TonB